MFTRIIIAHALARLLQHTMTTERKYDRRDVKSDSQTYLSGSTVTNKRGERAEHKNVMRNCVHARWQTVDESGNSPMNSENLHHQWNWHKTKKRKKRLIIPKIERKMSGISCLKLLHPASSSYNMKATLFHSSWLCSLKSHATARCQSKGFPISHRLRSCVCANRTTDSDSQLFSNPTRWMASARKREERRVEK